MNDRNGAQQRSVVVLARADEIPDGGRKQVVVNDTAVAVFRIAGEYFAVQADCPHRGGPLIKGTVTGYTLRCPLHGWTFDLRTGDSGGRRTI